MKKFVMTAAATLFLCVTATAAFSGQPAPANGSNWTPADEQQLNDLLAKKAIELLGPPEAGFEGYKGNFKTKQPVPPGCTAREVRDPKLHKAFVRVTCG